MTTVPLAGTGGIGIQGIAVNPVLDQIYVADDMNYELAVIDGTTNAVSYINTGNTEMLGLSVDVATSQVVGAPSGGVMDVINPFTQTLRHIPVGQINEDVAVNFFTNLAYITNENGSTLGVVNLKSSKVIANVTVGSSPYGVCVDYLSNKVFVTVVNSVVMVDGRTNTVAGSVSAGGTYLDVNPATRMVYVSGAVGNVMYVISE